MLAAAGVRTFDHLHEAVDAVEQRIKDVTDGTIDKIKASSGKYIESGLKTFVYKGIALSPNL